MPPNPIIVSIEGNIGAGKSTFLKSLEKHVYDSRMKNNNINFTISFVTEPVKDWMGLTTKDGISMLQNFYDNPTKNAFAFQILALSAICKDHHEMIRIHKENRVQGVMITERSVTSTSRVFTEMLHQKGYISEVEKISYVQMYNEVAQDISPSLIIYIQSNPDVCLFRVTNRARDGENNISMQYLTELHEAYEHWIQTTHIPVIRLTISPDATTFTDQDYAKILEEISAKIE